MADVLVVEPSALVRRMITEALLDAGLRATEAASAAAALRGVDEARRPPAVLVTDATLGRGGMGGLGLAAELRRRAPEIGVVYLTDRPGILAEGALGVRERCLAKPFEPARLARLVCELGPPCSNPPRRIRGQDVIR
jgi:CheY-like chemotaxis protein